jgi:tellurite resistance protein TerC
VAIEWIGLTAFVVLALAYDLRPSAHAAMSMRPALIWSIIWTALGALFAIFIFISYGASDAGDYLSGFLIEKSLSLDNLFVFAILFSFFQIPEAERQRVLVLGIVGAIVLRTIFIFAGIAILDAISWFTYVLGVLLAFTAWGVWRSGGHDMDPEDTRIMKVVRKVTPETASNFVLCLVAIAAFDVMFAIDSIPAIFAITRETYIVFAANAFSLLGMVSLYFLLDGLLDRFIYLSKGLAVILGYVALKLLLEDFVHPPEWVNLIVVIVTLGVAAWLSKRREVADARAAASSPEPRIG